MEGDQQHMGPCHMGFDPMWQIRAKILIWKVCYKWRETLVETSC